MSGIVALLLCSFIVNFAPVNAANSSLGVSPSEIKNEYLVRGAKYTEVITISRTDASAEAKIRFIVDDSTIEDWIVFADGAQLQMAKGVHRIAQRVEITIPANAAYKAYDGSIRVVMEGPSAGQVNILPGVKLDVSLAVSDKVFTKLRVLFIKFLPSAQGQPYAASIKIANEGNSEIAPDKLVVKIFDTSKNLLRTITIKDIPKVKAFTTAEIPLFLTDREPLGEGEYLTEVALFQGENEIFSDVASLVVFIGKPTEITVSPTPTGATSGTLSLLQIMTGLLVLIIVLLLAGLIGIWFVFVKKKNKDDDVPR